jgi:hypothetical protein
LNNNSGADRTVRTILHVVIAGLDPAISITVARLCQLNRDDRDKPGHDEGGAYGAKASRERFLT